MWTINTKNEIILKVTKIYVFIQKGGGGMWQAKSHKTLQKCQTSINQRSHIFNQFILEKIIDH